MPSGIFFILWDGKGFLEDYKIIIIYFCATFLYNGSTKGNDEMTQIEQLDTLLEKHGGMLYTTQVIGMGISKPIFYNFIRTRKMEQVAHGVYASEDAWVDAMFLLHLRCKQAVFSHETALYFHDLTDREPSRYSVTVKRGYSPSRLKKDGICAYTIKAELYEIGIMTAQTSFGNSVLVYDMERTICDLIRCRNNIEIQTFQDALKQYVHRKDKNLRTLMQYAGMLRVEKILRQYMEVLL